MAVYKFTGSSVKNGRTEYSSFLAGNPAIVNPAYESIATATGTGSSGVITFSSIPQTFKHLQLRSAVGIIGGGAVALTINSGSFARRHYTYGSGGGGSGIAGSDTGNDLFVTTNTTTNPYITSINIYDILDYTNTNKTKTYRGLAGQDFNGSGDAFLWTALDLSTTAINTITLTTSGGNFSTTTKIALYGIKGA